MQGFLLQSTTNWRFWAVFAIMLMLFAVVGPFGTFDRLNLPQRFAYWSSTMFGSWAIAILTIAICFGVLHPWLKGMAIVLVGCIIAPLPIALYLIWVVPLLLGEATIMTLWESYLYALPISLTFGVITQFALEVGNSRPAEPDSGKEPKDNPLLARLPVNKRGQIQFLSMQDHYIKVTTDRGSELLLMRMSDAVDLLKDEDGLQIHRSHWVARAAVKGTKRINGQPHLLLGDDTELPVSRTYAKTVREKGLI